MDCNLENLSFTDKVKALHDDIKNGKYKVDFGLYTKLLSESTGLQDALMKVDNFNLKEYELNTEDRSAVDKAKKLLPLSPAAAGKMMKVNPTGDGYFFVEPENAANVAWGGIAGNIDDQTDMWARATTWVNDIKTLISLPESFRTSETVVFMKSYFDGLNKGSGPFYWDQNMPKSNHTGGTIVDPEKTYPTDWNDQTQLEDWFTGDGVGNGCWVKNIDIVSIDDYGAVGDDLTPSDNGTTNPTDDYLPIQTACNNHAIVVARQNAGYFSSKEIILNKCLLDFRFSRLRSDAIGDFAIVVNALQRYKQGLINIEILHQNKTINTIADFQDNDGNDDPTKRISGVNLGGVGGILRNVSIIGFTGISLAYGDGSGDIGSPNPVESNTGITLKANSRAYYWEVSNINIVPTHGWEVVIPNRNNANLMTNYSSFPKNGFLQEDTPRENNCINSFIIEGIGNEFHRVSLESSPSEERIKFVNWANLNKFLGSTYCEDNLSWKPVGLPIVSGTEHTAENDVSIRYASGGAKKIFYDGGINNFKTELSGDANGVQTAIGETDNLLKNGNFDSTTLFEHWEQWTTGTVTVTENSTGGYMFGGSYKQDIEDGRPNIMHKVTNYINVDSLKGKKVIGRVWVKTNISGIGLRIGGVSQNKAIADGNWQCLETTTRVARDATSVSLQVITEGGTDTGYVEVANASFRIVGI